MRGISPRGTSSMRLAERSSPRRSTRGVSRSPGARVPPVVEGLTREGVDFHGRAGSANYSVSSTGVLVFVSQHPRRCQRDSVRSCGWIEREGSSGCRCRRVTTGLSESLPTSDGWCSTRTRAKRRPSGSTACPARARRDGSRSWATTALPSGRSMASEWCFNLIATVTSGCTGNALTARARRSGSRSRTKGRLTSRIRGRHWGIDSRSVRWRVPSARCGPCRFWTRKWSRSGT